MRGPALNGLPRTLASLALATLAVTADAAATPSSSAADDRPNVLVILTDDQRATDTLEWMPRTMGWFGQGGTAFTNAYATTPLCCPARAGLFTGQLGHNNGVRTNGDADVLVQEATIQRLLGDAGYRTALVGKYLNGWPVARNPEHFDEWLAMRPNPSTYSDVAWNDNGATGTIEGYSTDIIADRAATLIETDLGGADEQPWFLLVTPYAPHGPFEPATRHAGADVGTWPGNPAVGETDRRDKPPHVRRSRHTFNQALEVRQGQLRTLLAVDELVERLVLALETAGEENTLAFFLSDNGFLWAEHHLRGKNHPYTASIRVPFLMRWPGRVPAGATDERHVANVDIAPTIMDASGITPDPAFPPDGRSLLQPAARAKMLTEAWAPRGSWASIRADEYQYVEHRTPDGALSFREYYDLRRDPWQLRNLLGDRRPRNDPFVGPLAAELAGAHGCGGPGGCSAILDSPAVPTRCPGGRRARGRHLVGSDLRERIRGGPGRDVACGHGGRDRIRGNRGRDVLKGQRGADILTGGPGNDVLAGGPGRDLCVGGPGRTRYRGCERRR